MYANMLVEEPLDKVMEDWDFLNERVVKRFTRFMPKGQNIYGVRRRDIGVDGVHDAKKGQFGRALELTPAGLQEWQHTAFQLHVTLSGVPHHVEHNFGFWHVNDMDELYLPLPNPDPSTPGVFLVCMGNPAPGQSDRFVWFCLTCYTLLFEREYRSGDEGFEGFFKAERQAIVDFNSDPKNQLCPECGHRNPLGYHWMANEDTPEERAAREAW